MSNDNNKLLGAPWPEWPTKRLALLVCAEHWEWIARHKATDKSDWPMLRDLNMPHSCACCWYDAHHGNRCLKCPLHGHWASSKGSMCDAPKSPYVAWLEYHDMEAAARISQLAYKTLHKMHRGLQGRKLEVDTFFTGTLEAYVAAIDYRIGLTLKYADSTKAICIDRSRATYWPSNYTLPDYDRDFGLLVQGILRGRLSYASIANAGFRIADDVPNSLALAHVKGSHLTCAFE